jgi:DNA-binding transcriptional ArsR family regulator
MSTARAVRTTPQRRADPDACATAVIDGDRVAAVRAAMPAETDVDDLADVFGLLADPNRVRLLVAMLQGEMCVCDLAATTGMTESNVSHAMRLLRAHRVVTVRRSGRNAYYTLADAHVRMLLDLGLAHVGHATLAHPERDSTD